VGSAVARQPSTDLLALEGGWIGAEAHFPPGARGLTLMDDAEGDQAASGQAVR